MPRTKTTEEMVTTDWVPWKANERGRWDTGAIACASAVQTARELRRLNHTMERIEQLLLGLGRDGLHVVIREQRRLANERAAERKAAKKAAKERT